MTFSVLLRYLRVFIVLMSLTATSCESPTNFQQAVSTSTPSTTIPSSQATATQPLPSPSASSTEDPGVTPTSPPPQDTRYILTADFDYDRHQLIVEEVIQYTNRSPDTLVDLILMVEAAAYSGTFNLENVSWENGQAIWNYSLQGNQLHIPLPLPLAPNESLGLSLSYQLNLPSPIPSPTTRPVPFGYTARQTNLVDWYPFIPPYITGQGWRAHNPGYYGEHLVYETADFTVNLRLASGQQNLIIAASAPAQVDGEWYRYNYEDARNFAWSASPYYQVITSTVGTVTVLSYAFPVQEDANQAVLKTTSQALDLFSQLFAAYPHQTLSVVEADFLDGMEYDGLYFLSKGFYNLYQGTPAEYLITIAAHETAHQWWYGLVGNDQALEPWLDEALCTYSERLYYENFYPEALDWWWDYRINYYQPHGWIDTSIYNPHGEAEAFRSYRDAVYLNGAIFMEELRNLIDNQNFFSFLKDYAQGNRGKLSSADVFFSILNNHTQANIQPLLDKYFFTR